MFYSPPSFYTTGHNYQAATSGGSLQIFGNLLMAVLLRGRGVVGAGSANGGIAVYLFSAATSARRAALAASDSLSRRAAKVCDETGEE